MPSTSRFIIIVLKKGMSEYSKIYYIISVRQRKAGREVRGRGVCRFVNDVLHILKSEQSVFGRAPAKRSHREIVVLTLSDSKLVFEVVEGIE